MPAMPLVCHADATDATPSLMISYAAVAARRYAFFASFHRLRLPSLFTPMLAFRRRCRRLMPPDAAYFSLPLLPPADRESERRVFGYCLMPPLTLLRLRSMPQG